MKLVVFNPCVIVLVTLAVNVVTPEYFFSEVNESIATLVTLPYTSNVKDIFDAEDPYDPAVIPKFLRFTTPDEYVNVLPNIP